MNQQDKNQIKNMLNENIIETRYKIVSLVASEFDGICSGVVVEETSYTSCGITEVEQWATCDLEDAMKAICENAPDKFSIKHVNGSVSLPSRF